MLIEREMGSSVLVLEAVVAEKEGEPSIPVSEIVVPDKEVEYSIPVRKPFSSKWTFLVRRIPRFP